MPTTGDVERIEEQYRRAAAEGRRNVHVPEQDKRMGLLILSGVLFALAGVVFLCLAVMNAML